MWSYCITCTHAGADGLPVDHSLSFDSGDPTFPSISALAAPTKYLAASSKSFAATSLVAEGLPLLPIKLIEKIHRWEFIDLALLLHDASSKSEEIMLQQHKSLFSQLNKLKKERSTSVI